MPSPLIVTLALAGVQVPVAANQPDPVVAEYRVACSAGEVQIATPGSGSTVNFNFLVPAGTWTFEALAFDAAGNAIGEPIRSEPFTATEARMVTLILPNTITVTGA